MASSGNYHLVPIRKLSALEPEIDEFCRGAAIYLSVDIDVLDPVVAPEVAYASPGGLTLRELQDLLDRTLKDADLVGADFVEACDANDRRNLAVWSQVATITTVLENILASRSDSRSVGTLM